jgi:hypothetical protein
MSEYRFGLPQAIRENEILLVENGYENRLSFLATELFLNSIEMLILPANSSHLLQMFDVSAASPIKTAFKQELDKRVDYITHADREQRKKAYIIRRVLVESFINALRRQVMPTILSLSFRQPNRFHSIRKFLQILHTPSIPGYFILG